MELVQEAMQLYNAADVNKDDDISTFEWYDLKEDMTREEFVEAYDTDKDGKVAMSEFLKYSVHVKHKHRIAPPPSIPVTPLTSKRRKRAADDDDFDEGPAWARPKEKAIDWATLSPFLGGLASSMLCFALMRRKQVPVGTASAAAASAKPKAD